jgi:hypothetical protein
VNELCHRAREEQRERAEQLQALETRLAEVMDLAEENLNEANSVSAIQEVRADLNLVRKQIDESAVQLRRSGLWDRWQKSNHTAWERLQAIWAENEQLLIGTLDEAEERVKQSDPRGAKDAIKRFHAAVPEHECSHRALKSLRARSNALWQKADAISRERHARFLEQAAGRVDRWKQQQGREERRRAAIEREIEALERQVAQASTGVAHALLRGQLEERRKELQRSEATGRELQRQIDEAQGTLERR